MAGSAHTVQVQTDGLTGLSSAFRPTDAARVNVTIRY